MGLPQMKLASSDWQPFDDVYRAFAEANPMLGLGSSEFAATRLRQQYGEDLIAAGAAVRLRNRRWLAHVKRFGPALLEAMGVRQAELIAAARARKPEAATATAP